MAKVWEVDKVEEMCIPLFKACLKYINTDLLLYSHKSLNVESKIGIDGNNINAAAEVDKNGHYKITLQMASFNWLYNFYEVMLIQPGFYKLVSGEDNYNKDKVCLYHQELMEITLKTILFHEYGHIFNGHVDYIKFQKDLYEKQHSNIKKESEEGYSLFEISKTARPYISPMAWQAIEWNADDFAATRIVGQFTFKDSIDGDIIKSIEHGLWLTIIGMVSLYSLMGMGYKRNSIDQEDFKKLEHLPKRFRVKKYIEAELAAFELENGYKPKMYNNNIKSLFDATKIVEQWVNKYITVSNGDNENKWSTDNNTEELDDEHTGYYDLINGYYCIDMVKELEKYTYFPVYDNRTKSLMQQALLKVALDNKLGEGNWEAILNGARI